MIKPKDSKPPKTYTAFDKTMDRMTATSHNYTKLIKIRKAIYHGQ